MSMERVIHRAVQYIAAAGISHVPPEADDSHTTLVWEANHRAMVGRPIPTAHGCHFALCLPEYAFMFRSKTGDLLDTLPLQGADHGAVLGWFRRMLAEQGADPQAYTFEFHYELPEHQQYGAFPAPDEEALKGLAELRTIAHGAMELILAEHAGTEPARIWPHHFDSGALIIADRDRDGGISASIGIGLAVPDTMVREHYFYASPWRKEGVIDLDGMPPLMAGRWLSGAWKGAVMEAEGVNLSQAHGFLQRSAAALLTEISA